MLPTEIRVLVVDDNPGDAAFVWRELLKMGHCPRLARTGGEALQFFTHEHFDLVLLDLALPDFDDREVTRLCQVASDEARYTEVVALAGCVSTSVLERALVRGMSFFLSKPICHKQLAATLARVEGCVPESPSSAPETREQLRL